MAKQHPPAEIYKAILSLAGLKLLGPTGLTQPGILTRAQAFAFLVPTIQPRINGALYVNAELIACHAAHCNHIFPDWDAVISNYPLQFTLAAASLNVLQDEVLTGIAYLKV
ncbi:hypothetical protein PtA15_5A726 [Puccinia triticina]|uniref:Uncharacterized protein n=1 Tax=Puccinia triticina TaxID=208348 RepID=A0ABY7CR01_9BASI|nr:uncharacterized protein PtA15_5A726 [Puccinia triticina]WAQ85152.1 hypothetical protein PtA15_5A726 [Puccinia triticina]